MIINSKNNPKIKDFIKLKQKKYRNQARQFLVEGLHLVQEAKEAGLLEQVFVSKKSDYFEFSKKLIVSDEVIEALSELNTPQPIIGVSTYKKDQKIGSKVLYLDAIQDPGNIGTIIRLSRSFDIDTVIVKNFDIYNSKVLRATQGAFFHQNIIQVKDNITLQSLAKSGYQVIATNLDKTAKTLNEVRFADKFVIIMGNEGVGVSQEVLKIATEQLYIPISFESLNVATATAIILNKVRNG
ncbi:RNA methyltransferase [Mycoplasma sp. Ms02]|uniref:TrmH family RNA methyltransferase n=1 Tax=Mycoplasma sp. Ms02 TaxID=353851 RepID=UPI001C8A9961|nr:RNA methyltransferase [Mycoplasma sp. Ms02]QZE12267.1 RNA methyltransferase [Mycoplasma sp. Ms02]